MKKTIKTTIEVEIDNIKVSKDYFSFEYTISINGIKRDKKEYSNDYENGDTPSQWRKTLEDGYAVECALENLGYIELK